MTSAIKSLKGSLLLVGEALANKAVGLISTLILARVLVPEDFGLVAIATLLLGFIEVLGNTAGAQYLLRADDLNDDQVNTHFTLNLLIKVVLGVLFFLSAPIAAKFYNDERLVLIVQFLVLYMLVKALTNPAEAYLRRNHEYGRIVKVTIVSKLFSVTTAIVVALVFKSYWALLLGQFIQGLGVTIGSYIVNPYKPKFSLVDLKNQWDFSAWMIPQSVLGFFRTQLDTLIVSMSFGKASLGSYHVLKYLCYLPLSNVIAPATQPLLVELAQVKHDKTYFSKQFNISFIGVMLLVIPLTSMMYFHDSLIISVLLGSQWLEYSSLLSLLGFLIPATAMLHQANRVQIVYGKTKSLLYYEIFSFVSLYSILYFVGFDDLFYFSAWRVGLENLLTFSYMTFIAIRYTSLRSFVSLLFSIASLVILSCLAIFLSFRFSDWFALDVFNLLVVSVSYCLVFFLLLVGYYFIIGNKIAEWAYFFDLLRKILGIGFSKRES